jgi:hypothetical protein
LNIEVAQQCDQIALLVLMNLVTLCYDVMI